MLSEVTTLLIMALAVAMDAFSVSLGLGVYKLRLRKIFTIGLTVGFFHVLLPLAGILTGHLLSGTFGKITTYIASILLIIIGVQTVFFSSRKEEKNIILPVGWGLIFFATLISLDSFSAGLSLGLFGVRAAITVLCFGMVAVALTWSGLLIGRKVGRMLGIYGEIFGGLILIAFGIQLILPFPL